MLLLLQLLPLAGLIGIGWVLWRLTKELNKLMTGLERLQAAIADNTLAVDELVTAWNKPDATDEALNAAAGVLEANNARVRTTIGAL